MAQDTSKDDESTEGTGGRAESAEAPDEAAEATTRESKSEEAGQEARDQAGAYDDSYEESEDEDASSGPDNASTPYADDDYADDDYADEEYADDEDADYTYFCAACGHEQFDGELCEACGGDDWEFVRLDDEGLRRVAEARGEDWEEGGPSLAAGGAAVSCLTGELEATLDEFLDDLVLAIYGETQEAEGDEEASPRWKRLVAEETFREWVHSNREWLLEEILRTEEPRETSQETDGIAAEEEPTRGPDEE